MTSALSWPKRFLGPRHKQTQLPIDGFICNAQPFNPIPLSLIQDALACYCDASRESTLERMISEHQTTQAVQTPNVQTLMGLIVAHGISRYNPWFARLPETLRSPGNKPRILVLDQPRDSRVVTLGMGSLRQFEDMLETARLENPTAEIWIKSPVDPAGNPQRGHFDQIPAGLQRIEQCVNPYHLFLQFDRIYTGSSHLGFEALLAGLPVRVFGMPWYAGWGLTEDRLELARRKARPTLAQLFEIAYVHYPRYLNPFTHQDGTLNNVLECILLQRQIQQRQSALGKLVGIGFQRWKRRFAEPYLSASGHPVIWRSRDYQPVLGEQIVLWGAAPVPAHIQTPVLRMEDAFIHSDGLGSDIIAPRSQVLDRQGLYFNAAQSNDLLELCNRHAFSPELRARAEALRAQIVLLGITKYNLGRAAPRQRPPAGKRILLVPGQVADDAAIRLGSSHIDSAEALLREVRAANPDAWLIYKPHPDVLSGNRTGLIDARALCDQMEPEADIVSLIELCDELHTVSSLSGFDALMRKKPVYTYGLPFYAGWGLTHDAVSPMPLRQRMLNLDELIAAALILYPLYWDWDLGVFTTPEATVNQLAPCASRPLTKVQSQWLRPLRKAWRWFNNVRRVA